VHAGDCISNSVKIMPQLNSLLAYLLPLLAWGALTGIINLAFGYRSQIEAWAESNPRVAGLLKLSRALGLDPWNVLSALKLLASKKLPDAQKADSPIAKSEQRKADGKVRVDAVKDGTVHFGPPLLVLLVVGLCLSQQACSVVPITSKRCDFQSPEYTAHVAVCRKEIEETCLLNEDETPRADCPALVKCEAWRAKECE
jgi:hypothetical protein